MFLGHMSVQRNLAGGDSDLAWKEFNSRRFWSKIIFEYCEEHDTAPFKFFSNSLIPKSILLDKNTLPRISDGSLEVPIGLEQ